MQFCAPLPKEEPVLYINTQGRNSVVYHYPRKYQFSVPLPKKETVLCTITQGKTSFVYHYPRKNQFCIPLPKKEPVVVLFFCIPFETYTVLALDNVLILINP